MAADIRNPLALAAENVRLLKSRNGSIGWLARRSRSTNSRQQRRAQDESRAAFLVAPAGVSGPHQAPGDCDRASRD